MVKSYLSSMLPPGTPLSGNIFERGFYYSGKGIKYRSSFWSAWLLPASYGPFILFADLLMKYVGLSLAFSAFERGSREGVLGFIVAFAVNAERLFFCTFFPPAEIDFKEKVVRKGRFFKSVIPIDDIAGVFIARRRRKGLERKMNGTEIYLVPPSGKLRSIPMVFLYTWEENLTEIIKDALDNLLGKELDARYESDDEF